ncbi:unnamed protein product [Linum tenue]|uniref:Uncharacterized protein n=1 Tax=Linum tenue TaxID=586396 RepID=A0AAV0IIT7_9ROSI|nr:unnamed protein product [Linum tenue]
MFSIPSANDSKAETDPLPLLRHNAPHPVSNSISSHGQPFPHNSRVFFNGLKSAKFSGGSVISYHQWFNPTHIPPEWVYQCFMFHKMFNDTEAR